MSRWRRALARCFDHVHDHHRRKLIAACAEAERVAWARWDRAA